MAEDLENHVKELQRVAGDIDLLRDATINLDLTTPGLIQQQLEPLRKRFLAQMSKVEETNKTATTKFDTTQVYQDFMTKFYKLNLQGQVSSTPLTSRERPSDGEGMADAEALISRQNLRAREPLLGISLPKLSIKPFSGDSREFPTWRSLYDTLVHNNPALDNARKFQYMLQFTEGMARRLLTHLNAHPESYQVGYDLLISKYSSQRIILDSHYNNVAGFQRCRTERETLSEYLAIHVSARAVLLQAENVADFLFFRLCYANLPAQLKSEFEQSLQDPYQVPKSEDLIRFVERRLRSLENAGVDVPQAPGTNPRLHFGQKNFKTFMVTHQALDTPVGESRPRPPCSFCLRDSGHRIYGCTNFQNIPVEERLQWVHRTGRCVNCLSSHRTGICRSKGSCLICGARHHTSLHSGERAAPSTNPGVESATVCKRLAENPGKQNRTGEPSDSDEKGRGPQADRGTEDPVTTAGTSQTFTTQTDSPVLLGTARVVCLDAYGIGRPARFLIDCGADRTLITRKLADQLALIRQPCRINLQGIGAQATTVKETTQFKFKTLPPESQIIEVSALVISDLLGKLPSAPVKSKIVEHLTGFRLADDLFYQPSTIDGVLGNDVCSGLVKHIMAVPCGEAIIHVWSTLLGAVPMGKIPQEFSTQYRGTATGLAVISSGALGAVLGSGVGRTNSEHEDFFCERLYRRTTRRAVDGRFIVELPLKQDPPELGQSRAAAYRIYMALERRLEKASPLVKEKFHFFMTDFIDKKYMEPATEGGAYYLPYHYIIKGDPTHLSSRLRCVFNYSAPTSNGRSLNDYLCSGPNLLASITEILTRFRCGKFYVVSDITQMFLRLWLAEKHRRFQHIFYKAPGTHVPIEYRINCVTFGSASSPFLAVRSLHQLAEENRRDFPLAFDSIKHSSYMDDILSCASSRQELLEVRQQLESLMQRGGFSLAKYVSNDPSCLVAVPEERLAADQEVAKVLGLIVNVQKDTFSVHIPHFSADKVTKREILSHVQTVWDPLGFLAPSMLRLKLFLQSLWRMRLSWDRPIPEGLQLEWARLVDDLRSAGCISIPRFIARGEQRRLICFSDCSNLAMAASVYLHTDLPLEGKGRAYLVACKTRVAKSKNISTPRGELLGAELLSGMYVKYSSLLTGINRDQTLLFTDSQVVICWLRGPLERRETFVRNHVVTILGRTPKQYWKYIPSSQNLADLPSRGVPAKELYKRREFWLSGAPLLDRPYGELVQLMADWQNDKDVIGGENTPEESRCHILVAAPGEVVTPTERFSSLRTLTRVTAYVLRFLAKIRRNPTSSFIREVPEEVRRGGNTGLSVAELLNSELACVFLTQEMYFGNQKRMLERGKVAKEWRQLSVFLDSRELLRVGGRLKNSDLPYDQKHPFILPKNANLSKLLVRSAHITCMHAGPGVTRAMVRRRYWIVSATILVKKIIRECVRCTRFSRIVCSPRMGDLPSTRVQTGKLFEVTHLDLGGPFLYKVTQLRGTKTQKSYLCVFVDSAVKAVHLEILTDLTTQAMLATLQRFSGRRGKVKRIHCDRATNFRGCAVELKAAYDFLNGPGVERLMTEELIEFRFQPAASPWWGGLHEAAIRESKRLLVKLIGDKVLSLEDLNTLFIRCESILNSRPIALHSTDPDEDTFLTPWHFITGEATTAIPEEIVDEEEQVRCRWKRIKWISQQLWIKFRKFYLNLIISRTKWVSSRNQVEEGQLVLVKKQAVGPLGWPLGKIIELMRSPSDGEPRVAKVRIGNKEVVKSLRNLTPLVLAKNEGASNEAEGTEEEEEMRDRVAEEGSGGIGEEVE